jgi:hypothetical protein
MADKARAAGLKRAGTLGTSAPQASGRVNRMAPAPAARAAGDKRSQGRQSARPDR